MTSPDVLPPTSLGGLPELNGKGPWVSGVGLINQGNGPTGVVFTQRDPKWTLFFRSNLDAGPCPFWLSIDKGTYNELTNNYRQVYG